MKDFKGAVAQPRKIALYAHLTMDSYFQVWEVHYSQFDKHFRPLPEGERRECAMEGYVRISEPVDLTFTPTDDDSIVRNAVQSLDEEEQKLRTELAKKLADLHERRNQLMALTHQVEA